MAERGILVTEPVIADGRLHRVHVEGHKARSRNAWYLLHLDGRPAGAFGCFKAGVKFKWAGTASPMSREERASLMLALAQARAEKDAQQQLKHARAAERARHIWDRSRQCTSHPYLTRKGIQAFGLRIGSWETRDSQGMPIRCENALLVPVRDEKKNVHSLQAIFESAVLDGRDKDYLAGGAKTGNFYTIGKPVVADEREVIVICEGYATGASLHEATGHAVVVAFDAANLRPVAEKLRRRFPDADIVIFTDRDAELLAKSVGTREGVAAALAIEGRVVVLEWTGVKGRDANDLICSGWQRGGVAYEAAAVLSSCVRYATRVGTPAFASLKEECGIVTPLGRVALSRLTPTDDRPDQSALHQVQLSVQGRGLCPPDLSEDSLALTFATRADRFRWTPGRDWMVDDGVRWSKDDSLQRYTFARDICSEAAATLGEDRQEFARRLASGKTVDAVLKLARSDKRLVVLPDQWDSDPMLLNTPGGVVQLRTGEMFARGQQYFTQATLVAPVPGPAPNWNRFITEVCCGDADLKGFIQRMLGYGLTGDRREQVLFFWYGLGANGKSVLSDFFRWILGDYALKLPASVLMTSRGERHPTEIAQLAGKRLAVSSELDETSFFNEALVKELTGDESATARFMRGDFFQFGLTHKHVIIGNFKPRFRGGDSAMARRMRLVPFNATFDGPAKDPLMLTKLKAEAPAILSWMVQGAREWSEGGLAPAKIVLDASKEYMMDNDDLALWIDECCDQEGETKANDLYQSFSRWKKSRGEHPLSQTSWGARLTALPGVTKKRSNGMRYSGLTLKAIERERLNCAF